MLPHYILRMTAKIILLKIHHIKLVLVHFREFPESLMVIHQTVIFQFKFS